MLDQNIVNIAYVLAAVLFIYGLRVLAHPRTAVKGNRTAALGMLLVYATFGCVIGRLVAYCSFHWPPISLWGRIWTFRWIIPGYDQALVAPLCALMVGIMAPVATYSLGVLWRFAFPTSLTLMLLITLGMGPRLRQWRLTGNHRITAAGLNRKEFEEL